MTHSLAARITRAISEAAYGGLLQPKGDNIMTTIGNFTRENNLFTGIIRTLTFTAYVTIEPLTDKRGEKSPDYRVFCQSSGPGEIGAAWKRNGDGGEYLSLRIDDPSFPAPINCRLVKTGSEQDYALFWERQRPRD